MRGYVLDVHICIHALPSLVHLVLMWCTCRCMRAHEQLAKERLTAIYIYCDIRFYMFMPLEGSQENLLMHALILHTNGGRDRLVTHCVHMRLNFPTLWEFHGMRGYLRVLIHGDCILCRLPSGS